MIEQLKFLLDPIKLIESFGYAGLAFIIFAESGLLFGFFFPGDSLLFTAGLLSSRGILNIAAVVAISFVAAVAGDNVGYSFGKKVGPRIFNREKSLLFDKEHLVKAQIFYEKHGSKTIVLARFMPFIRTFAPIVAGVGSMDYKTFFTFNLIGGLLWAVGMPLAGYFLGRVIPDIDKYLLPIIGFIILASVLPTAIHLLKERLVSR